MKNLMFINSICTNFLEFIKPWFVSLNINWIEIILPGAFTLLGAGLGAFLAGKYAVNVVTSQLNYDKNNKRIDIIDNDLKIGNEFTIKLSLLISDIERNQIIFLKKESTEISENLDKHINSIKELNSYTKEIHDNLSVLQINSIPFEDYRRYRSALVSVNTLNIILNRMETIYKHKKLILKDSKKYDNEKIKNIDKKIESDYFDFTKIRDEIIKNKEEISEQYLNSSEEHRMLKEKINEITKN